MLRLVMSNRNVGCPAVVIVSFAKKEDGRESYALVQKHVGRLQDRVCKQTKLKQRLVNLVFRV